MGIKGQGTQSDQARRIVAKFGSTYALARALTEVSGETVRHTTIQRWIEGDGYIPQKYHQLVYNAGNAKGVPLAKEDFTAISE